VQIKKELLSPEEKVILADFVNSEYWPVYRKVKINNMRNIEKVGLTAENMEKLEFYKGQYFANRQDLNYFTRNFTKVTKGKK
jgi:hypothetical protein